MLMYIKVPGLSSQKKTKQKQNIYLDDADIIAVFLLLHQFRSQKLALLKVNKETKIQLRVDCEN